MSEQDDLEFAKVAQGRAPAPLTAPSPVAPLAQSTASLDELIARAQSSRSRWAPHEPAPRSEEPEVFTLHGTPSKHAWCLKASPEELAKGSDPGALKSLGRHEGPLHCVLIFGPQRAGKTNLAVWLAARACARRRAPGFFIKAETLGGVCRSTTAPPELERALRVPVLVLDDLGTESRNEETRAMITRVLTEREARSEWVTVVTHGLEMPRGLGERYGAAVLGRYTDPTTSLTVEVNNQWKARSQDGR